MSITYAPHIYFIPKSFLVAIGKSIWYQIHFSADYSYALPFKGLGKRYVIVYEQIERAKNIIRSCTDKSDEGESRQCDKLILGVKYYLEMLGSEVDESDSLVIAFVEFSFPSYIPRVVRFVFPRPYRRNIPP